MEIINKLQLLKQACEICNKNDYVRAIDTYFHNINAPISIMLVGEGNNGKTCLLNGLLGRTVAKEGFGVKTANKNYYRNVKGRQYVSTTSYELANGNEFEVQNEDELFSYYEKFRVENNVDVYWSLNLEWPSKEIVVIDTEGFNQINGHSEYKQSDISLSTGANVVYSDLFDVIYSEADIIIWCVKGEYLESTKEKYELVKVYNKPIFLVYTFADEEIENENLVGIDTPEDLIRDMRGHLVNISQECVKDFAGFAGDYKYPDRKENFLKELRNEISTYINSCNKGLKYEVGERLFQGIYNELSNTMHLKVEEGYNLLFDYYSYLDELTNRINSIQEEYVQRISDVLDRMNASVAHDTLYQKAYEDCGHSFSKSFEVIMQHYERLFSEESALHEIVDVMLSEKAKVMEDEFVYGMSFIDDSEYERVDFSKMWDLQKELFMKLKDGWGIIAKWKSRKFIEYFESLKCTWRKQMEAEFSKIHSAYMYGVESYIDKKYQSTKCSYVEQIIFNEWIEQKLNRIVQKKNSVCAEECCIYGLKEKQMIATIVGKHNKIYSRFAFEKPNAFETNKILIEQYIEKELQKWKRKIIFFCNRFTYEIPSVAYEEIKNSNFTDIIIVPECFEDLPIIQCEIDFLNKADNYTRDIFQTYYVDSIALLHEFYSKYKRKLVAEIELEIQEEIAGWVQQNFSAELAKEYVSWKNGFGDYLRKYQSNNKVKSVRYYVFSSYLKLRKTDVAELYLNVTDENWDNIAIEYWMKREDIEIFSIREKKFLEEMRNVIKRLEQYADDEEKRQYDSICVLNEKICMETIKAHLIDVKRIGLKIICLRVVSLDKSATEYEFKRKIREASVGITEHEKRLLLNDYADVRQDMFNEFYQSAQYCKIERKLEDYFQKEKKKILSDCMKKIQRSQKNG